MLITGVLYRAIREFFLRFGTQNVIFMAIFIGLAGAWEALFVYDSILFGLTMAKTWKGRHEFAIIRASVPIISLIFRDGKFHDLNHFATMLTFTYRCYLFCVSYLSSWRCVN